MVPKLKSVGSVASAVDEKEAIPRVKSPAPVGATTSVRPMKLDPLSIKWVKYSKSVPVMPPEAATEISKEADTVPVV